MVVPIHVCFQRTKLYGTLTEYASICQDSRMSKYGFASFITRLGCESKVV